MKAKFLSIFLLCLPILNFSCSKDEDEPTPEPCPDPTYQVPGLWIGTYSVTQRPQQAPMYQSFTFKPDGKLITDGVVPTGETYYSSGTWSLNGTTLSATYTTINFPDYIVNQTATFTYSNTGVLTNGIWTDVNNPFGLDYSGTFSTMDRVK